MARHLTFLRSGSRSETDAIRDYCGSVSTALEARGRTVDSLDTTWPPPSFTDFCRALFHRDWKDRWCVLHYTAFLWSRRGLPLWLVPAFMRLKHGGARIAVRFHDPQGHPGSHAVHRARRLAQHALMRQLTRIADRTLHNVPLESIPWLPSGASHAAYIPVGSTIPPGQAQWVPPSLAEKLSVAMFSMGTPASFDNHVNLVCETLRLAAPRLSRPLKLLAFGRGMLETGPALQTQLSPHGIDCEFHGLLSPEDTSRLLHRAQALLFVRGPISTQRTSVLAGVANAIPTVGYSGPETTGSILNAGILTAGASNASALADELVRVLSSDTLWHEMHERSLAAYAAHFSWDRIAARYDELLP